MKRLLNCTASDFASMNKDELLQSIQASEGRTMLAEVVCSTTPLYPGLTNAEYVAAFGADLVLLNVFDVDKPSVEGLELLEKKVETNDIIQTVKELVGRPVGINLEPVDIHANELETLEQLPAGRRATDNTIQKAIGLGVDFICLTGNPKTGVSNDAIEKAIKMVKNIAGDKILIIAGKMHGAGTKIDTAEGLADNVSVQRFVQAGADIVLVPGVGTVPGATLSKTERLIQAIHNEGALALTTIGTSQEGSTVETIQNIALYNKMAGADVHHIGDAGLHGIAPPENIMNYSIAIRGKRHTYTRMAASIKR
ncbi:DUF7916 family protein [Virgibacillus sp. MG-45]|uniref:DUF7916 family protein n=1 Tax=Virgibacillus sp. MG-45 TaxID=3102791 RepID=UPI002ED840C5